MAWTPWYTHCFSECFYCHSSLQVKELIWTLKDSCSQETACESWDDLDLIMEMNSLEPPKPHAQTVHKQFTQNQLTGAPCRIGQSNSSHRNQFTVEPTLCSLAIKRQWPFCINLKSHYGRLCWLRCGRTTNESQLTIPTNGFKAAVDKSVLKQLSGNSYDKI